MKKINRRTSYRLINKWKIISKRKGSNRGTGIWHSLSDILVMWVSCLTLYPSYRLNTTENMESNYNPQTL